MNIKLLSDKATMPTRGTEYSAGLDLYAAKDAVVLPGSTTMVPTDIAMEIPLGNFGAIFPRSGLATKMGLRLANSVAVIDADYRGNIIVALYNDSNEPREIKIGDRIAQLVIIPYNFVFLDVVDKLNDTERGDGGFGSTGSR